MHRSLAFVLHATAAGTMMWGWFGMVEETKGLLIMNQKGGYFLFLTNQGLLFAWLYMTTSIFCDVFPCVAVARHLKRTLLMISLPMSFVVSSIYWSLISFFPHLIVSPTVVSQTTPGFEPKLAGLPLPIDLALHALPLFTLLIDFFAFEPKFSKEHVRKAAPGAVVGFSIWYASFVEYCATFSGSFPYPFLEHSPFPVRVLIYTATTGIALACFRTLNTLHA